MKIDKCIKIIRSYFDNNITIIEIGNHSLDRHFVFKVESNSSFVMKFYFKPGKWDREVSSLNMLYSNVFKTPKLIEHGITDGIEWILYEYTEGEVLTGLDLCTEDLNTIYYSLGKNVALIHKNNQFKQFGRLDVNLNFYRKYETNKEYVRFITKNAIKNLKRFTHKEQDLLDKAIDKLNNSIEELEPIENGYLCHNDISDRNILITNNTFSKLIDFEQASISDRYRELAMIKYYLTKKDTAFYDMFIKGYKKVYDVDKKELQKRTSTYLLLYGIMICSWSLKVDKDHYNEGIELIKTCCSDDISLKY